MKQDQDYSEGNGHSLWVQHLSNQDDALMQYV